METEKILALEFGKVIQFIVLWSIPMILVRWSGNYNFLWLLLGSLLLTQPLWEHYEKLIRIYLGEEKDLVEDEDSEDKNNQG